MSIDKINIPKASILMGSLRSIGYIFGAAVADIIDNSITAQSTEVRVLFPRHPDEPLAIGILDNGVGMSNERLFEAMRYGMTAPESEREGNDLGRFGMGMKSASLSQCRVLTKGEPNKAADDEKRKLAMEGKITAMQRKCHDLTLLRGKRRDYIIAKALKRLLREASWLGRGERETDSGVYLRLVDFPQAVREVVRRHVLTAKDRLRRG